VIALGAAVLACLSCVVGMPVAAQAVQAAESRCTVAVSIPSIGVREELRYYEGSPDDAPGTRIQDTGRLASPLGAGGGVRAGETGNHFIAGHRTSAGAPLLHLRKLKTGDRVVVQSQCVGSDKVTHTYAVTARSRYIDFFTRAGRAAQIAPVPFQPGVAPFTAMITLSTCATQEDRARGDMREDRFGNPPGRWVVVGVLESTVVG
jgi:sortase A